MASTSVVVKDFSKDLPGKLSADQTVYEFPTIEGKNARGKPTYWTIYVKALDANDAPTKITPDYFSKTTNELPTIKGWIKVDSKIGADGKIKEAPATIVTTGKNLGKANQTNPFTQALRDAFSKYNKQLQKTQEDTADQAVKLYPPMLANDLKKIKKDINFEGAVVQRKRNGVRGVATCKFEDNKCNVIMYSRTRKEFPRMSLLKSVIREPMEYFTSDKILKFFGSDAAHATLFLDGEIYKHGMLRDDISGITRTLLEGSADPRENELGFFVFDCFVPELPELTFSQRYALLTEIFRVFKPIPGKLELVQNFPISSREEAQSYYEKFIAEKYEGAIIRWPLPYVYSYNGYHTDNMLKLKEIFDDEFEIVGYKSSNVGKAAGTLILVLQTKAGKQFNVSSLDDIDMEERKRLYKQMGEIDPTTGKTVFETKYKGKRITVEYEELSDKGTPVRAVLRGGLSPRDYE